MFYRNASKWGGGRGLARADCFLVKDRSNSFCFRSLFNEGKFDEIPKLYNEKYFGSYGGKVLVFSNDGKLHQ